MIRFVIIKAGPFYFFALAPVKTQAIFTSYFFKTKKQCERSILAVRLASQNPANYVMEATEGGNLYFKLVDKKGIILGISLYSRTEKARANNIRLFKKHAQTAPETMFENGELRFTTLK